MTQADIDSIIWNLQTWPLELIEWNVTNSQRTDILFQPVGPATGQRSMKKKTLKKRGE